VSNGFDDDGLFDEGTVEWACLACKTSNTLHVDALSLSMDEGSAEAKCSNCGKRYYLSLHPEYVVDEMFDADQVDKEEAEEEFNRTHPLVEISRDGGHTWSEERLDVRNVDPATSAIKPGDMVQVLGKTYKIPLADSPSDLRERFSQMLAAEPVDSDGTPGA